MRPRPTTSRPIALLVAATAAAALTACGSGAAQPPTPDAVRGVTDPAQTEPAQTEPAQTAAAYPLELDNCGFPITVTAPPERVLTIKSSTLELMLALGLSDRVAGASFLDGPIPESYGAAAQEIEVVSERAPGPEAVLTMEPDMVFAGWESSFSAESAGEREALDALGVLTYVAPSACKAPGYQPDPLTFDDVFADIAEAGAIFGVPEAAEELVTRQQAQLAQITPDSRRPTALWYSSGSDTPFVGAGIGAPQMIMDAAGLTNIAADVRDTWTSLSWEVVVDADPDVIVLVDAAWNTAENKIAQLEGHPATSGLTAVREGRYLVVPFPATEAGVRNVAAAQALAEGLADLELDG